MLSQIVAKSFKHPQSFFKPTQCESEKCDYTYKIN